MEARKLDFTSLTEAEKMPLLFNYFDELAFEETLNVFDNRDLQPYYDQLIAGRDNVVICKKLENNQLSTSLEITKRLIPVIEKTLGDLVAMDVRNAEVFKKYGLDFCCGGKKTIKQACAENGLKLSEVEKDLEIVEKTIGNSLHYKEWEADFLAAYIENTHHAYVKRTLPLLMAYAIKVANAHGQAHPQLQKILSLVEDINTEMTLHMLKEEEVLFPFIKSLVIANNHQSSIENDGFGNIQNPISVMESDHEMVGKKLEAIRKLSNQYEIPEDACGSYRILYQKLEEFEADLHFHVHLENNILFPKAIALQQKMTTAELLGSPS